MGLASGRNKVRVGMPFRNALPSFPRPRCVHEKERRVFKTRKRHANKNKRVQPQRAVVCPSNDQGCTALSGCILFCNGTLSSECFSRQFTIVVLPRTRRHKGHTVSLRWRQQFSLHHGSNEEQCSPMHKARRAIDHRKNIFCSHTSNMLAHFHSWA